MGLEKKLTQDGSSLSKANGGSIPTPVGATDQSTLQNTYSINANRIVILIFIIKIFNF